MPKSSGPRPPLRRAFKRMRTGRGRVTKFVRKRRKGSARPSRSLSLGYRGAPNQYRYIRE